MTMIDLLTSGLAISAGVGLGLLFFGGLWVTVHRGVASDSPALWFMASAVIRTGLVMVGFYVVSGGAWPRLLWCLLGFVIVRECIARLSRCTAPHFPHGNAEKDHAA